MANIGMVLKGEITRLAGRAVRQHVDPIKKAGAAHRRDIAELKRQLAVLRRQVSMLVRLSSRASAGQDARDAPTRFVAKGLVSLRARLGLSAADLAKLIGVSGQSVYNWEAKKSVPRKEQVTAIAALRNLGKREVHAKLEQLSVKPARRPRHRRTSK